MSPLENICNTTFKIYECAAEMVDLMRDHERITVPELSNHVANKLEMDFKSVRSIIDFFVSNHPNLVITAGKYGGVFKNGRAQKSLKSDALNKALLEEMNKVFDSNE